MLQAISAGWERIRTEVKAADRKVEALLASTDPGRVTGDALYISAAYPFHASKLNEATIIAPTTTIAVSSARPIPVITGGTPSFSAR